MLKVVHVTRPGSEDDKVREIAMRWVRNDQKKLPHRLQQLEKQRLAAEANRSNESI